MVDDVRRFLALIEPGRRFVLTTHVNPDGDGLGSELALAYLLRARGAEVRIVNHDPSPERLRFLDPDDTIETYAPELHDPWLESADVVVMLDNADPQRLASMRGALDRCRGVRVSIDHHPDPASYWDFLLLRLGASSTGEIVAELLHAAQLDPPRAVATALYAALSSDTGRFRFANTDAAAFDLAAWLVRRGAAPAEIYSQLELGVSLGYCRLLGHALTHLEVAAGGRLVVLRIPQSLPEAAAADGEDLARIINEGLRLAGCRIASLYRELSPVETKVSLRSTGPLDVQRIAKAHGGGGHRNAAGVVLQLPMEQAIARLTPELTALVAD